jgi:hypothetical protein
MGWYSIVLPVVLAASVFSACSSSSSATDSTGAPLTDGGPGTSFAFGDGGFTGPCKPRTCADAKATCGAVSDGCGHILLCGACKATEVCKQGENHCVAQKDLCGGDMSCGTVLDACGNTFECGTCPVGYKCEATNNLCSTCEPVSCDGKCGKFPNGCGGVIECAGCETGQVCDAVDFKCGPCVQKTCDDYPQFCGLLSDGCGKIVECPCPVPGPVPACVNMGAECGLVNDPCIVNKVYDCGQCIDKKTCINHQCTGCTPRGCEALGANCGEIDDGCGGKVKCGNCTVPGETCGGGGTANLCAVCKPKDCATLNKNCGEVNDGCGNKITCGTCTTAGEVCGGGGAANVCGVCKQIPKTCADPGPDGGVVQRCGDYGDGCGGMLHCGDCTVAGETCGGAGTANVCGVCMPKTCTSATDEGGTLQRCGDVDDGCGKKITCGDCTTAGETCGGGGTANICAVCVPKTCEDLKRICGEADDGCGHKLACPGCAVGQICLTNGTCCQPKACGTCGATGDDGCGGVLSCPPC